ncbi:MATE family efflux transporter [Siccirubricoccus sp. G192]|uniref:MATE family efflux transporter n=1 Tax=Siccirubricoccus sp. G192 TaxID=2849651 RepID=UPI0020C52D0A|nr:MATE family efflux transporter [Siccirubricoccus sp. G192]
MPEGLSSLTAASGPASPAPSATPWPVLLRRVLALAAPTTLLAAVQSACQLVEPWLAARQGTAALAGWAVMLPFVLLLQQMSAGAMGGGVVSAIARALGAGRREEASALVLHAVVIALGFGLAFAVLLAGFPHALLGLIGGAEAAEAAASYAVWMFGVGAIPAWLANTLASVLRGGGRHALASRVLLLAWLAYPPLAWALMEPGGAGAGRLGHGLRRGDGGGDARHGGGGAGGAARASGRRCGCGCNCRCSGASSRSG